MEFEKNTAEYGPDQASSVLQLNTYDRFFPLASGQLIEQSLLVYLQDSLGQVLTRDSSTHAQLSSDSVQLSGKLQAIANKGVFSFTG
ncbi:MAG: hypothetical protein J0651_03405, partial [Actinobacteria bacterium]|nr:hypothetical protein [Actinomycetota bacterium]